MNIIHIKLIPPKAFGLAGILLTAAALAALHPETPIDTQNRTDSLAAGRQWAVFIAIDQYGQQPPLPNPVKDARELRDILVSAYLFHEIRELYNERATLDNIRSLFADLRRESGVNDSVFVFFAGYGYQDKFASQGFWIPAGAGADQTGWLSNREVGDALSLLPAKHVLLVSDGCFSEGVDTASEPVSDAAAGMEYYRQAYNKVSRQVLTSGAVKTGPGSGPFALSLKQALRSAPGPYLDAASLLSRIDVQSPRPVLGVIKDAQTPERTFLYRGASHQKGGSFVFFKQAGMPMVPSLRTVRSGNVMVTSEIGGMLMLEGRETGTAIQANGSAMLWNVPVGERAVAVKDPSGAATNALRTVRVREGATAEALIEHPFIDRFARIPGGVFMMGSPASEYQRNDDEAQHQVMVRDFLMQAQAVRVEEFRRFVQETGYKTQAETRGGYVWTGASWELTPGARWDNSGIAQEDTHPVVLVSWYDAVNYCNWRSEREGLAPAYTIRGTAVTWNRDSGGYRLPTEAEWEYAARAGTATPFHTGAGITREQANFNSAYPYKGGAPEAPREATVAADSFAPNTWGLYNMHGNVWEWCWDVYGAYQEGASSEARNTAYRSRRGGGWSYAGQYLRSAYRSYGAAPSAYNSTGFRLARSLPEAPR